MKRDIIISLMEIVLTVILVAISIPIWKSLEIDKTKIDTSSVGNSLTMYMVKDLNLESMSPVEDDDQLEPAQLYVYNQSSTESTGILVFNFTKNSDLDYNYLKIKINDQVYNLADLYLTSNSSDYVFLLDELDLSKYQSKEYEISLWIDSTSSNNDVYGKYFGYDIAVSNTM